MNTTHSSRDLCITTVTGAALCPFLPDAARLRISVFREYPYLYDGDMHYESKYLHTYCEAPDSLFVIAQDAGRVVGVSTGVPLARETDAVQRPFVEAGIDPASVFYFGESVLEPEFRGRGTGVRFFAEREKFARSLPGMVRAAFCAVERPDDHPRRPADYVPLDEFWKHRGFTKTSLSTKFTWREIGDAQASPKTMIFWMKEFDPA